ncbi:MAG: hypothetical protein Q8J62_09120 [Candidatus Cloacimonadaceae bacterium]|nr:hypothetical protein [Candidatus Cloacimonadaceae bacterium]
MLQLLKKDRCPRCREERAVRQCPRIRKAIGWQCCNTFRHDLKCPDECGFKPRFNDEKPSPFPAFRADSNTEFRHALKLFIDFWINKPIDKLDDLSPLTCAKDNKDKLLAWLTAFQYPANFPMEYLMDKLGFPSERLEEFTDPESVTMKYLDNLIALEWDKLRALSVNDLPMDDVSKRYEEILSAIPELKKVKHHRVIQGGVADDGVTAMVFLELNYKHDWTLILSSASGEWKVRQNLAGNPGLFYNQNKIYKDIAEALSEGKDDLVWELLQSNQKLYPDSSDLYYYRALYWQLVKQPDKAKVDFFSSIALDNGFYMPIFTLGAIYLSEKNPAEALIWFDILHDRHPEDINVTNNLAASLAGKGETGKAIGLWKRILTIDPNYELAKKNLERYADG